MFRTCSGFQSKAFKRVPHVSYVLNVFGVRVGRFSFIVCFVSLKFSNFEKQLFWKLSEQIGKKDGFRRSKLVAMFRSLILSPQ